MNSLEGFQLYHTDQTMRHCSVLENLCRTNAALKVLRAQFHNWEHTLNLIGRNGMMKRWHLASKCSALIKHDRILRGES